MFAPAMFALAAALLVLPRAAEARPKRRDARAAFDRGVAAYKKSNFEAASAALNKSYELERDVDTLFAWAQSERKLSHCEKAIELYEELLTFDLPAGNRTAVDSELAGCRAMVTEQHPAAEPAPAVEPAPPPPPEPKAALLPPVAEAPVAAVAPPVDEAPQVESRRAWYKDPIALSLTGAGVVALGVGTGLLVSAHSLDSDAKAAFADQKYDRAQTLADQARSRTTVSEVTLGIGGALVIGGAVWIVMHSERDQHVITGWLAPGGGGLAVAGGF